MTYVDRHLIPNERVLRRGQVSATSYLGPALLLLLGLATAVFLVGILLIVCSIILFIRLATTEVAVTDRRIIGKVGWIATRSLDLRLAKLEGVSVSRGLLGAIFNYGSIKVVGSGSTRAVFPGMSNPEALRRAFVDAAERASASTSQQPSLGQPPTVVLPLFEVQIIDSSTGHESWVEVKAKDKNEAIRRATDTGMITGECRLKSIG